MRFVPKVIFYNNFSLLLLGQVLFKITHIMKRITIKSLTILFSLAMFVGCKKEEITVQKNDKSQWDIEKNFVDDDIRTRLGYDPRYEYATPTSSEVVAPMLTLQGFTLADKNTRTLEVKLTKASEKDVNVSLVYDATLFDKVKSNYSGYELGEASLVQIPTAQKTIAAGTTTTTFEIQVTNQSDFSKKVILPFAVKVSNNDFVKTISGKDYFVVRIYPKGLTFDTVNKKVAKEATFKNGKAEMADKVVNIAVTSSDATGSAISLGLERDNTLVTTGTLAPDNVVGTISKIDFKDKTSATFSFTLQNIEGITATGTYIVPFKLMAYDAAGTGHKVLDTPILVNIEVTEKGIPDRNTIVEINSYSGALIANTKYSFTSNYAGGHLYKIKDGTTLTGNWWIDTYRTGNQTVILWTEFNTPTVVNGIKITQETAGKRVEALAVYASDNTSISTFKSQGTYEAQGSPGEEVYLKFEKPIKAKYLMLTYFENTQDQYIDIHEMEFF